MAAVPIAMDVVIYPKGRAGGDQPYAAFISGPAWRTDVGVGGGPLPGGPGDGGGGGDEHPAHPIVIPPDPPVLPPDLPDPIPPSSVIKPPPPSGGWGLHSTADGGLYWSFYPGPGFAAPKK